MAQEQVHSRLVQEQVHNRFLQEQVHSRFLQEQVHSRFLLEQAHSRFLLEQAHSRFQEQVHSKKQLARTRKLGHMTKRHTPSVRRRASKNNQLLQPLTKPTQRPNRD